MRCVPVVIPLAWNWNVLVVSTLSWIVNALSVTVAAGSVLVTSKSVPKLLTTTNLFALPDRVGSLSKPAVIRSSSDRIDADVA